MPRRNAAIAGAVLSFAILAAGLLTWSSNRDEPTSQTGNKRIAYGISGEEPGAFPDSRFLALGLRKARVQVSWDLYSHRSLKAYPGLADEQRRLAAWLEGARRAGISDVLVAFKPSRDRPRELPVDQEYRKGVERVLDEIDRLGYGGFIHSASPWNEPELSRSSADDPEQAGRYYRVIKGVCQDRGCVPLAGEFSDAHLTPAYLRSYRASSGEAPLWAWHAYADGRGRTTKRLDRFLAQLPAGTRVALTEQGGVVYRPGDPPIVQSATKAAGDLAFLLRESATRPQIESFYVYQWKGEAPPRWDSGLISPSGETRPSYDVFARWVNTAS